MRQAKRNTAAKCEICQEENGQVHALQKQLREQIKEEFEIDMTKVSQACSKCQFHIKMISQQMEQEDTNGKSCVYCGSVDVLDIKNTTPVKKNTLPQKICSPCSYICSIAEHYRFLLQKTGTVLTNKRVRFSDSNAEENIRTNGTPPQTESHPVMLYSTRDITRNRKIVASKEKPSKPVKVTKKKTSKETDDVVKKPIDYSGLGKTFDVALFKACRVSLARTDISSYTHAGSIQKPKTSSSVTPKKRGRKKKVVDVHVESEDEYEEILGLEDTVNPDSSKAVILKAIHIESASDNSDVEEVLPSVKTDTKKKDKSKKVLSLDCESDHDEYVQKKKVPSRRKSVFFASPPPPSADDSDNEDKPQSLHEQKDDENIVESVTKPSNTNKDTTDLETHVKQVEEEDEEEEEEEACDTSNTQTEASRTTSMDAQINDDDEEHIIDELMDTDKSISENVMDVDAIPREDDEIIERDMDSMEPDGDAIERDVDTISELIQSDELLPKKIPNLVPHEEFSDRDDINNIVLGFIDDGEHPERFCESPVQMSPVSDPYLTSTVEDGSPEKELSSVFPSYDSMPMNME